MEVIKFFVSIYETAIGDIGIRNLCFSGIYLVGSMSIAILPYILKNKDTFMKEYKENRPYLKDVLDRIPIYVIKEKDIGLDGAFVSYFVILSLFSNSKVDPKIVSSKNKKKMLLYYTNTQYVLIAKAIEKNILNQSSIFLFFIIKQKNYFHSIISNLICMAHFS